MHGRLMLLLFVLPLGAFLAGDIKPTPPEDLRAVYFYLDRFYENADPPFTAAERQILPASSLSLDRIDEAVRTHGLVIEVCRVVLEGEEGWREPEGLSERRQYCQSRGTPRE